MKSSVRVCVHRGIQWVEKMQWITRAKHCCLHSVEIEFKDDLDDLIQANQTEE